MTITCPASGTQTAVINTEHTLSGIAVAGTYSLHVDLTNMASGDTVELRIYQIILTGGTPKVAYKQSYSGVQGEDNNIAISVPIANELTDSNSLKFTLKQTEGTTGKAFIWKILKY